MWPTCASPEAENGAFIPPVVCRWQSFPCHISLSMIAFLEREFGVHCAIGGTGAIVQAMVDLISRQGGEVRCGCDVEEITVSGKTATGVGSFPVKR